MNGLGVRHTAAGEAQPLTIVDAARDVDLDRMPPADAAGATTGIARVGDHLTARAARTARTRGDDLAQQRAAHLSDLAAAVAGRAPVGMGPERAAGSGAALALQEHLHIEGLARAEHDVGKREIEHRLGVGSACTGPTTAARAPSAEERVEQVVQTERTRVERAARAEGTGIRALGSEHVIAATPFRVAQRFVRVVDLLEALDRGRVVRVRVRVILASERAERLLDLVVRRIGRHAEHLVVVHVRLIARAGVRAVARRSRPRPVPCDSPCGWGRARRRCRPARLR